MSVLRNSEQPSAIVASHEIGDFQFVDREELIEEWNVIQSGKKQGRQNLPQTSAVMRDSYEQTYLQDLDQLAIRARNRLDQALDQLRSLMDQISNTADLVSLKSALPVFEAELSSRETSERTILEDQIVEIRKVDDEIQDFKRQNHLNREADYKESWTLTIGLILIALIGEAMLNSTLLAAASSIGLIGGIGMAIIISGINILIGALTGLYIWPLINHTNTNKSYAGIVLTIVTAFTALLFNLLIAHYREVLVIDPDNSGVLALSHFAEGILNITDIESAFLGIIGIGVCLVVAIKTYTQNDKYPGYTKLSKRLNGLKEYFDETQARLESDFDEIFDDEITSLEDYVENININCKKFAQAKSKFNLTIDQYHSYLKDLKTFGSVVLTKYRESNVSERTEPAPEYFDERVDIEFDLEGVNTNFNDRFEELNSEQRGAERDLPHIKEKYLEIKQKYSDTLYGINYP